MEVFASTSLYLTITFILNGCKNEKQNLVLNSSRTNIDCNRDLGYGPPYVLWGPLFPPYKKPKSMGDTRIEYTSFIKQAQVWGHKV